MKKGQKEFPGGCSQVNKCTAPTEVYSRVCGFFRPVQQWNKGKKEEFKNRLNYNLQGVKDGQKAE